MEKESAWRPLGENQITAAAPKADPTTPANLQREDGRGLFLMRHLMDRVERFTDGGNVVRLVLNRA